MVSKKQFPKKLTYKHLKSSIKNDVSWGLNKESPKSKSRKEYIYKQIITPLYKMTKSDCLPNQ